MRRGYLERQSGDRLAAVEARDRLTSEIEDEQLAR
jgi:hypothetical protein